MTIWDDRLLELIRAGEGGRVGLLADCERIRISRSQVSRRCRRLTEKGLLRTLGNGVYLITPEGDAYLQGEYDAEESSYVEDAC
jgi:DNA-binding IclR family transcriptional regulator